MAKIYKKKKIFYCSDAPLKKKKNICRRYYGCRFSRVSYIFHTRFLGFVPNFAVPNFSASSLYDDTPVTFVRRPRPRFCRRSHGDRSRFSRGRLPPVRARAEQSIWPRPVFEFQLEDLVHTCRHPPPPYPCVELKPIIVVLQP